ncbi:alpha/beta hydrolase fold domain-containing protein [Roseomonas xinghualingensis]|uniref:alpha/beta hydrolase fold domain-containing protein n=1 Tax=Roseomonas xinghualingensis TaxID=2986475 RepID=UPI0021F2101A|nr:alpha/beta hydrolase [Roseomonas sp. SXEYE001]MCV4206469.1 alpha/beta hydrolase [Roseomonas sp. SXEYE001]
MASLRARLLAAMFRVSGVKRVASDTERFTRVVHWGQRRGAAQPGRGRERRLRIGRESFGGYPVFTAAPRQGGSNHHILYLHGGAYVFDMAGLHWRVIERMIERTGATVTIPLYPLAPGHNWRDAFGMVRPLHAALATRHGAEALTVMGDSAGGGMALALAQQLRDAGEALPARLVLFSPWLDVTMRDPGQLEIDPSDPFLAVPPARLAGKWYAADLPTDDPRVSPIFGSLAGLPPIAVFTGTRDMLNSDARRLRARAAEEGAALAFHEEAGMIHVWMMMPVPEARLALDKAAAFMTEVPPAD